MGKAARAVGLIPEAVRGCACCQTPSGRRPALRPGRRRTADLHPPGGPHPGDRR
ncbi:hypothetical protein SCATT_27150 [Streptantibioticus cattleyicolor NRRL 8057 = DSM 46488]|uniref:Uncharacterized protein n=1 Tax=Streptantibioticus cattleyicolor (strain ATCC 35852 / DSM 46488 / JCM 4925 / NBRC 14057 / NRRL 8057) TaxID=1003195 RepID=G8X2H0_STREN|nr:hypothetical protein SCATT_27150 [Streptantibioticus cattleyicolor NRRL 8057 = DSM 46488]